MGNSCSSGQAHKDRDNMSQKSEESATYQVRTNVPTDKQKQVLLNHVSHSGIILEPTTAGQPPLKQHAAGVASTTTSVTSAAVDSTGTTTATATAVTTGTTTTGGSLSERRPTIAKVFKESMSLSSPPGTHSPKDFAKMDSHLPSEVANLTEQLQYLIMGRIGQAKTETRTRKIVIYVCAADSQDCCVEKGALHNKVYPELRAHCRTRGYELHIVDLHWKTLLEKQQDHEFPELCVGELTRQMEVAYVIPVLFLNNSLGTPLLPITIESADFKLAMESAENRSAQSLLSKWYQLDSDAQPPCYRLQSIAYHIPGFKETSPEERERALEEWRTEIDRTLAVLITVFSQELRDTYLTTVVEQEVHNTVFMSQELAKRCIWLNRVYTPCERTPENLNVGEIELQRRLNTLQRDLRNQLAEKHLVRLPVKYVDGGLNVDVPEHAHYIEQVVGHLSKHLREMIDSIVEEHRSKSLLKPSHGIEAALFEELNQQTSFCQKAAQCSVNREKTINEIRNYITSDRAAPLVVYGPGGCGKTTLLARVAQCCQQWVPDAFLVLRFVGISAQSSTVEQVLSSILNQCSILTYGHKNYDTHNVKTYTKSLSTVLGALGMQRRSSLILVVDGLDQVRPFSSATLEWLPATLPDNVKLVLSVNESTEMHREMARLFDADAFLEMPLLDETEARGILMSSVVQYNHSVNSKIQDCVLKSVQECTLPLYSKVLAWQTSWWADKEHDIVPKGHVNDQLKLMLEELETILGVTQVQHALAIMTGTKHGITDSEMIDLLARDETFHNATTYVKWAPACLAWSRLNKHLAPFLQWTLTGGVLGVQWRDNMLLQAVTLRYKEHTRWAHQMLFDYYAGKPCETRPDRLQARFVSQDTLLGKCYNRRKLDELPYHYHALDASGLSRSVYLTDIDWIYDKVCGSNCYQLLEDIHMAVASLGSSDADVDELNRLQLLRDFFETNAVYLNYDGRQFYAQLRYHLDAKIAAGERSLADRHVRELYERTKRPPVLTIMPMTPRAANDDDDGGATTFNERRFNLITRLIGTRRFVVSIATDREEIAVWDVKKCEKVRTLTGIGHPINLIPIDKYRCIVLCRRELRIYDLNAGRFVTKLKGVMNQKMPYYGLHDRCHLVALSRNRMYVNLMNLETGDCVTTFKAGEDRFLNSLLVSGDGRVLVCGDETQKPFPLLVWSLQSKKLLYDLRIPHHDFITSLSAITHEGNYVCCVCHEIDEPNPNFIVVYDLQSGTLFKKWKPSCDTVSLEISSTGSCVVSGLEDARILVWDLITGNCRWEFAGHTAPVNLLRLDPTGFVCLSTDSEGRDRSIRVWDLNKGNLVAVFTPKANITGCELMANGRHVVLALEGHDRLVTLKLVGPDVDAEATADNDEEDEEADEEEFYGEPENDGKTFELNESDVC